MSNCPPNNGLECRTIQVIAPDETVLVSSSTGSGDRSLDERGSVILEQNQDLVDVPFQVPKAGAYRFEYLYVEAPGVDSSAGIDQPTPLLQTAFNFRVLLSPKTSIQSGYILQWRVVVTEVTVATGFQTELIYVQMPRTNTFEVFFTNPRTTRDYNFDELRVENLIDNVGLQTPILVQVVEKTESSFTLGVNPTPPTDNYFLSAKVPST